MPRQTKIAKIAHGPHGRTDELTQLLARFDQAPTMLDSRGLLVEDLRSYLARVLPNASIQEAQLFGRQAALARGKKETARAVSVVIRAYAMFMETRPSAKSGSGSADDDGNAQNERPGPGNNKRQNKKDRDDPR